MCLAYKVTRPSQSVALALPANIAIEYAIYLVLVCKHTHRLSIETFSPQFAELERWNSAETRAMAIMADLAASRE